MSGIGRVSDAPGTAPEPEEHGDGAGTAAPEAPPRLPVDPAASFGVPVDPAWAARSKQLDAELDLYERLTPEQAQMASTIVNVLGADRTDAVGDFLNVIKPAIGSPSGAALLQSLYELATTERNPDLGRQNPPITTRDLLSQTLTCLLDPCKITQGDHKGTCGAATMEYLVLKRDPVEFVKLVNGLASKAGSARLEGGGDLELPDTAIPPDSSERTDVDRLLQSAIMNQANLVGLSYNNKNDDGSLFATLVGDSAIGIGDFQKLYQRMMGKPVCEKSCFLSQVNEVGAKIQAAVAMGEDVPVLTGFGGKTALHWLCVEGMNYDPQGNPLSVTLRNPWGSDSGEGDPPRVPLGEGRIVMKYRDLLDILDGAVIPQNVEAGLLSASVPFTTKTKVIKTLLDQSASGHDQRTIRNVLLGCGPEELSRVLDGVDLARLKDALDPDYLAAIRAKLAESRDVAHNARHLANLG